MCDFYKAKRIDPILNSRFSQTTIDNSLNEEKRSSDTIYDYKIFLFKYIGVPDCSIGLSDFDGTRDTYGIYEGTGRSFEDKFSFKEQSGA